ncbi:MAG: amino acid adenylation domain-containing protein [Mojavia pulchra JT2-VF2]|jgi:amino acid adenylation domain-containing protein|uniref:Amino acid adenylation domain-containing protein n=1 Tax=Mojavia pulchra JT2-VF2 TaxID=287848 RepID=A0A951PW00_9NOST|nr:amino acid adenylation domain-containing protein [Mojavia pulchra JT2-VF2]
MNTTSNKLDYQPNLQLDSLMVTNAVRVIQEQDDTETLYTNAFCIHELFEGQVKRTPDAIAVVFEGQQLTYQQLNTKANQLAHYLQKLGVRPEVLVGICIERSLEMVVGLLGILKAGGAYVPLDPAYPQERLGFILEDTKTSIILTTEQLAKNLASHKAQVVCLDSDWEVIAHNSQENLATEVTVENLSYVIYTSGSTGQPKGVMISHRSICNTLYWRQTTFKITEQDKVLQTISFSFDPSVWQIFWPLSFGGQLIMARPGGHSDTAYLVQTIIEQQITIIALVPSVIRVLLEEKGIENCQSLRHVTSGGEALPIELINKFCAYLKLDNVLVNCYGPTEASIDATSWTCQPGTNYIFAPIGRPIANTQIYILNEDLQPVPVGEPGELHIGGIGLARGYLNLPELTDKKFISNPFSNEPGARLYKTGDLARYLPDGNIEFLGRIDHQVKIRGFRIELGEIETTLSQHPVVKQAVVIAREDIAGDKRLVAYIVLNSQPAPTINEWRSFLKQTLPDYMVPSSFVILEDLPLTPNGKVDRRALPAPDAYSILLDTNFVPPSNRTEEILAGIWSKVLGVEQVGIHDNFFELGGHSLLATQVISRIRQALTVNISLRSLFENPTVAGLAVIIDQHQSTDINFQLQTIPKLVNRESIPLSFGQQRMWFWEQLQPGSSIYHTAETLHLQGDLNITVLQQSLDTIVARHEALRTNFIVQDGNPVQVIQPPQTVELLEFNLKDIPVSERLAQIEQLLQQQTQRPFNFASDLMLRSCLLQIDQQEYILLLVMHHIASDGWSTNILWQELASLYQAFISDKPNPLPKLPIQYADYAVWQRQWLTGEILEKQLNYWKQQLADAPPVLELFTNRPRPPIQTYQGESQFFTIPQDLSQSLQTLSRQESVTLFMTLLAAFQTLLYRYSGQEDILVGSAIAGRNHQEIEGLIGFFVNTLALRSDMSGNPSFRELLQRVRHRATEAYHHQDLPFEKLVEELQLKRSLSYHPIFQVMFILQNTSYQDLELPGLTIAPRELNTHKSAFDITLEVLETPKGIKGKIQYNTDIFDAATITRMIEHWQTLLAEIVTNPEQNISALPLLTASEQHQIFVEWNDTKFDYLQDQCIHELFEAQVKRTPHAVAVVFKDQQLTYQQLNTKANQLAHYLQKLGVAPEVLVGICMERSLEMIVGLLGILKAGGAYVPLDPAYPQERLAFMLEDSQLTIVLTQSKLFSRLPSHQGKVVYLDSNWQAIAQQSQENTASKVTPGNLAYTIYTSGSTGKPKGVQILHQAVANFLASMKQEPGLTAADVLLAVTTISFDIAVLELFLPITVGAKVVLASREVAADANQLIKLLAESGATVMQATPATWRMLIAANWQGNQNLKILCGGEAMTRSLANQLLSRNGAVWNMYGPTETTIWSTIYRVEVGDTPILIGKPIANTQIYLIDQNPENQNQSINVVPVGQAGELVIGGVGLARGYLNRPELTNEKFINNPFSKEPGTRLYRTGDLARYLPDGNIELIGRVDNQVKIRGFRIELGEIEATLSQHPIVEQTAVTVREDVPGDKRLVAYIVPSSQPTPTINEWRSFLKQTLPDYMIPSSFVILKDLPLTPNGKVDRRVLPAPEFSRLEPQATYVAPRNAAERQLIQIWEEVLRIQPIGIRDNFFELGGHSLLAVNLFWQIQKTFGQNLPLAILFQSPTVEALAQIICQEQLETNKASAKTTWSSLVPIQPKGSKPPLFCVHGVGGEVLCFRELAMHLGTDQPFYGLQPQGLDGKQPPLTRVEDMAAHYIQEIQTIQPVGPYFLSGYSFGGNVAFEMAQQLHRQGQQVALLVMFDSCRPGYDVRLPFVKRLAQHLNNLLQLGPDYLWQRTQVWRKWSQHLLKSIIYSFKQKSQRYLNVQSYLWDTDRHLEITDANVAAISKYTFQPYPGRAVLFRTDDQLRVNAVGIQYDPQFGWGDIVTGGLDIHRIPGSHFSLLNEPYVQVVAEKLKLYLSQSADAQSGQLIT